MKRRQFIRASLTIASGGLSVLTGVVAVVRSEGSSASENAIVTATKAWISEIDGNERMHDYRSAIAEALAVPPELMMMPPESYYTIRKYL